MASLAWQDTLTACITAWMRSSRLRLPLSRHQYNSVGLSELPNMDTQLPNMDGSVGLSELVAEITEPIGEFTFTEAALDTALDMTQTKG